MRDALPNASFIGLTGTPIEIEDASTRAVFGDHITICDVRRAVEDGATVPICYESRLARPATDKRLDFTRCSMLRGAPSGLSVEAGHFDVSILASVTRATVEGAAAADANMLASIIGAARADDEVALEIDYPAPPRTGRGAGDRHAPAARVPAGVRGRGALRACGAARNRMGRRVDSGHRCREQPRRPLLPPAGRLPRRRTGNRRGRGPAWGTSGITCGGCSSNSRRTAARGC